MREKELRLALICYGGISLAIYMHGITKEIWRVARASQSFHRGIPPKNRVEAAYVELLKLIETHDDLKLRILPDIIAGASAGGINGIFLAQAIASGESLDPLTDMWLEKADVDELLDPDARPFSRFSKFWATPIVWLALGRRGGTVQRTVAAEARDEVRAKVSRLVRARWFEPPFGGQGFTTMLLDAFDAMKAGPVGERLIPKGQPLDLFVTVTDFGGYSEQLRLNSPSEISETEHRLTLSFSDRREKAGGLGDSVELAFAARATASFPGAFPPVNVAEIDQVLAVRGRAWDTRAAFLSRILPGHGAQTENAVLIDGSVLANAPFKPALEALRDRPARREIDRRFVYIDPKPGIQSVSLTKKGKTQLPGFFSTIFGAMSDIPREQPIRDSLEAIEARSTRIRRMQHIIDALRPDVEAAIESLFGRTFFLDRPNPARIKAWRNKAQERAARDANYAFSAYGHIKLSGIVEELAGFAAKQNVALRGGKFDDFRHMLWKEVRARGIDQVTGGLGKGATVAAIGFFRDHDLGFRIRRLRFVIRTLRTRIEQGAFDSSEAEPLRATLFMLLARYLDLETINFYKAFNSISARAFLDDVAHQRALPDLDAATDAELAEALANAPKAARRSVLFAYLGFPFYDVSTLPLLQGEGLSEFDPVKIDRISPEDVTVVRRGVTETLKGIQFNSFGAFFSRAYRENDYLWGRLHGADRLFDIILSATQVPPAKADAIKRALLLEILNEEEGRLTRIPDLFGKIRDEIAANASTA
jgi:patatin-related protein